MEQKDATLGQWTAQEGDGSELESDCPSASNETQHQPNTVVQGEKVGEPNEIAAGNQKKKTLKRERRGWYQK